MTRHQLLTRLHETLQPRTYLETGVNTGKSLALSRARSVGIDPAFTIVCPVQCDLQLVRLPSDDYFAGPDCGAHFAGVPLDLAFIDGMHLSEFALRDFINVEKLMSETGVVVFDDMLPRNALEAARDRKTKGWTGDVYKAVEVLRRHRPDLVVLLVNTHPTGTAVVVNLDPKSQVLSEAYSAEESYLLKPDPQTPPDEYLDRSIAVEPDALLSSHVWHQLAQHRDTSTPGGLEPLWDELRGLEGGSASTRNRVKEPADL